MSLESPVENKPRALLFVIACVALWSFVAVVSKFGQNTLDTFQFLFWSSLLSFVILLFCTFAAGKFGVMAGYSRRQAAGAFGLGFLGAFMYYLLLYYGYAHAPGLEVLPIQYTWPIFIVLFSMAFLGEKLSARTVISMALGFAGVLVVLTGGNLAQLRFDNVPVDLVVLVGAASFGLFSVLSKKIRLEAFSAATYFFLSATVFSVISMLAFSRFAIPPAESFVPVLANGLLVNGITYVLWLKALDYAKASFLAPFVFITPVLAALLVVAFFNEAFVPAYAAGLGLVVIAGMISARS